jgi:HSP20 family molecular chaperone IbpA
VPLDPSTPPVNIYGGSRQLSVAIPIPGSHPDHVTVHLAARRLGVRAECKYPQEDQHYHRRDWQVGSWAVDLALPQAVDPANARATLNLGVLVVMAPLSDTAGIERDVPVELPR